MLVHTSIRTRDIDRSIDFYTRLLGLKLLRRREIPQNNAEIAFLQDPEGKGSRLELTYYRDQKNFIQAEYEDRLFDHLAFQVKNMEEAIVPAIYDPSKIDITIMVETEVAYETTRQIVKNEGIFVGMSSGAAMYAALEIAKRIESGTIVVVFPDRGEKYLSTKLFKE